MDGRSRAALAVAARRGELGMTQADLAVKASVNVKTIGNLESRGRWPTAATRYKLEVALGWPPGTMASIAAAPEPDARPWVPSEKLRAQILEELGPDEGERLIAEMERRLNPPPPPPAARPEPRVRRPA